VVAAGDAAAVEGTFSGTHTGPLATPQGTIPATGRRVSISYCIVGRSRDGKLASGHNHFDLLGILAQLGVVPASSTA
jgi:predicted ester cyclase